MNAMLREPIEQAASLIASARRIALLTGAGVSAESGVGTFRDAQTGLWSRFDPQQLASQEGFAQDPDMVWRWYMHRLAIVEQAQPNPGHQAIAALERLIPEVTLITQNVDDLHERAGSSGVLHLHGHIGQFHCNECQAPYTLRPGDRESPMPPGCIHCTGYIRPGVVWFGEMLPERALHRAWTAAERCDLFLVIGTSGVVYPAAQLPLIAKRSGSRVIEINPEASALSPWADVLLLERSGEVLPIVVEKVRLALPGLTD